MEDTSQYFVYLGLVLVSLLAGALGTCGRRQAAAHGMRLPPGPWQLPVIGSLHHLVRQLPHHAMRDLAQRHGPVMLLRLGEVPTLVVSSRDAAAEVMKHQDRTFATRPMNATARVLSCDGRNIALAPYGTYWRHVRRLAVTELLTARRVRAFRAIREEEVASMLRDVEAAAAADRPVELRARLSALVTDTTFRAVMGDRCKERDLFLLELQRVAELATGLNPADLWPSSWLARRLSGAVRRAQESRDTMFRIIDGIIQEHLDRNGGGDREDLLDVLLKIHKDGELDMLSVKAVIFDIFNAGSETSSTALEWATAELIRNPAVMKKATAEVRGAFEAGSTVAEDRLGELRYLHLVIRETLRLHPPLPLLVPRECREPCQVLGYDVPRGTQVIVNAWALGRDRRYWPGAAEEFRPERFEETAVDFRGTDYELVPFGAGRRMCPGMAFGLANVELPLASLLLHFDWEAPEISDPAEFDMTEAFGITVRRKANLLLRPALCVPLPAPGTTGGTWAVPCRNGTVLSCFMPLQVMPSRNTKRVGPYRYGRANLFSRPNNARGTAACFRIVPSQACPSKYIC